MHRLMRRSASLPADARSGARTARRGDAVRTPLRTPDRPGVRLHNGCSPRRPASRAPAVAAPRSRRLPPSGPWPTRPHPGSAGQRPGPSDGRMGSSADATGRGTMRTSPPTRPVRVTTLTCIGGSAGPDRPRRPHDRPVAAPSERAQPARLSGGLGRLGLLQHVASPPDSLDIMLAACRGSNLLS